MAHDDKQERKEVRDFARYCLAQPDSTADIRRLAQYALLAASTQLNAAAPTRGTGSGDADLVHPEASSGKGQGNAPQSAPSSDAAASHEQPPVIGYAVRMETGNFVGIWTDRSLAESICSRQPVSHGDRVIPVCEAHDDGST